MGKPCRAPENKGSKEERGGVTVFPYTQCVLSFMTCLFSRQQRQARVNIPGTSGKLSGGDVVQLRGEQVIKEINISKPLVWSQPGSRRCIYFFTEHNKIPVLPAFEERRLGCLGEQQ